MIGTTASVKQVMAALNTIDGLSNWWTVHTTGATGKGDVLQFRFPKQGPDMRVIETTNQKVVWECIAGVDEWVGTRLHFEVSAQDGQTLLMFKHAGWTDETPFFHHCSTKWAVFLLSLKAYLDTGEGQPFPHDVQITLD
jgi:hypothetical protein